MRSWRRPARATTSPNGVPAGWGRKRKGCPNGRVVLGHAYEVDVDRRLSEAVARRVGKRARNLSGAIGAEVEKDDPIAILNLADRPPIVADNHGRLDELVACIGRVAGLDRFRR